MQTSKKSTAPSVGGRGVLAYITGCYPRATDTFIQREVQGLRALGWQVHTFSVRRSDASHDVSDFIRSEKLATQYLLPLPWLRLLGANLGFALRQLRHYLQTLALAHRTARPGLRGWLYNMVYFQEAVVLALALRKQGVQHLHNHLGDASGTVAMLAAELAGIGYSITVHGPHLFFDPLHWSLPDKLRRSRFIACISHYCQSQLMLFSKPEDWARLAIVHCGVDPDQYTVQPIRCSATQLLYVGRLAAEKGLLILLESLHQLRNMRVPVYLTLVGDGEDRDLLLQRVAQLELSDMVHFAGFANEAGVRAHLQAADVFVLPSFAEGVPVSLMEAMACGVPVVSTYVGGISELVEPDVTGMLVPASDATALAQALVKLLTNPELRQELARKGRARVEEQYHLGRQIHQLSGLFAQAIVQGASA